MKVVRTVVELRSEIEQVRAKNQRVGFVPTMGFLHDGHLSLVEKSNSENECTVVSIYVNPSQFNEASDFDSYPRNEENDIAMLEKTSCMIVFIPSVSEIEVLELPKNVDLRGLENVMEGQCRPGHFQGVIEVVYRLFRAVNPASAYFGEKDFQQLMVIQKMVEDCQLPIKIVGCPVHRERSGLAMSSRNSRLSVAGLDTASFIHQTITNSSLSIAEMKAELSRKSFDVEYIEAYSFGKGKRLFIAAWLEGVRLIDNIALD